MLDPKTRDEYDERRGVADKPFAAGCYAPWTSLYFNTNGDVVACCKNTKYVFGNVGRERLDDIWRGNKVRALRRSLGKYSFGLGCEFCGWQIQGRQWSGLHAARYDDLPVDGGEEDIGWPTQMEFAMSNTCNLACVMCYGVLSSTIRAHREKLPPLPRVYSDEFFADLRKYLPHLKRASFVGGEPFLMPESYKVWDMMIEDGLQTPCQVTTNGTQWGKKVERVLDALPISISVSMDGVTRETVESVRVNADFDKVRANVLRFREYVRQKGTSMSMSYCLMQQNWHEFGRYLAFAEELDVPVYVHTVIHPDRSSLYMLPPFGLKKVLAGLERDDAQFSALPRNGRIWSETLEHLRVHLATHGTRSVDEVKQSASELRGSEGNDPLERAGARIEKGRYDDALELLQPLTEGEQDKATLYQALTLQGRALRLANREGAEEVLARAVEVWPKAPNAFLERAWFYLSSGRPDEALADAVAGRDAIGGDLAHTLAPDAFDVLGLSSAACGDAETAVAAMDELVQMKPLYADSHVHRAWVYERLGRVEDALRSLDEALELEPECQEAVMMRERLRAD